MAGSPKTPGATEQERALSEISARQWNDYRERYVPLQDSYLNEIRNLDNRTDELRGAAVADATMATEGQPLAAVQMGKTVGSAGRGLAGGLDVLTARTGAQGLSMARAKQVSEDAKMKGLLGFAQLGRGIAADTTGNLTESASRATENTLASFDRSNERRNSMMSTASSFAGMGLSAYGGGSF